MFRSVDPKLLMNEEEYALFQGLDDVVTIYRGVTPYNAENVDALSWTLDQKTAEWFAHRFGEEGTVYKAQIEKAHIYAVFTGRNELEVIIDPKQVQKQIIGRITFASGGTEDFTDPQKYLQAVREELPYQAATGFRCETLTDDPALKKAVDDMLCDLYGEENSRQIEDYRGTGMTMGGMQ